MKRKRVEAYRVYESSDSEDVFDLAEHIRGFVYLILARVVRSFRPVSVFKRRRLR
jgi:hypothetical protein